MNHATPIRTRGKNHSVISRGFTLLIAVLVSGVLVALGSAIFDIVSKEVILSSSGRESQFAFYAADTGIECALYWDNKQNAFSSTSPLTSVNCGGSTATLTRTYTNNYPTLGRDQEVTNFSFSYNNVITNPCTNITVTKLSNPTMITIQSYGHNTCVLNNPLRLERAIQVAY